MIFLNSLNETKMKKGRVGLTKELIENDIKYNLERIEYLKLRIKNHRKQLKEMDKPKKHLESFKPNF